MVIKKSLAGVISRASLGIGVAVVHVSVWAQIATDGSLGSGPAGPVLPGADGTITIPANLGRTVCNVDHTTCNLYHSFSEFNVNEGQSAVFTAPTNVDPTTVESVLARVTGANASRIDGLLSTVGSGGVGMPNADFYLINPNGVVFGPGAQLDVGGSFVVTTANELHLSDGQIFSTRPDPGADALLATAPPSAFGFLSPPEVPQESISEVPPAGVGINGSRLEIDAGEAISVVSGDVHTTNSWLVAPSGRVNLVSVTSDGEVRFDSPNQVPSLDVTKFESMGDIFVQDSTVSVRGDPGGTVMIQSGDITIEGSNVMAQTIGNIDHLGVGIDVEVSGDFVFRGLEISSSSTGSGRPGDIRIVGSNVEIVGDLAIERFTNLGSRAFGNGGGGATIGVTADRVEIADGAIIEGSTFGSGNAAKIVIVTDSLEIRGDERLSAISTLSQGSGNAGNIEISAKRVRVEGGSTGFAGITTQTNGAGTGAAGRLRIDAGLLELRNGAQISSSVFNGSKNAGDVEVSADSITISGRSVNGVPAGIFSTVDSPAASGNGGLVRVVTGELNILDGGQVSASSLISRGDSGNVLVEGDHILIDGLGSRIASDALAQVAELAVTLDISHAFNAEVITTLVSPGGVRRTLFFGVGSDSENFSSTTLDNHAMSHIRTGSAPFTGIFLPEQSFDVFIGEQINGVWALEITDRRPSINTGTLNSWSLAFGDTQFESSDVGHTIGETAVVRSEVLADLGDQTVVGFTFLEDAGEGGPVTVTSDLIEIRNGGEISARTTGSGRSGNVTVAAHRLLVSDQGQIRTTSEGPGNAGDIDVFVDENVLLSQGGRVTTSADIVNAGQVALTVGTTIEVLDSTISAEAGADGGNIKLTAPDRVQIVDSTITGRAGGDGARISIDPQFVILQNSVIDGRAGGRPVSVFVDPNAVFLRDSASQILTPTVSLPPELDIVASLLTLPGSLLDTRGQLTESCAARFSRDVSSFTVLGRGGVPVRVDGWIPGVDLADPYRRATPSQQEPQPSVTDGGNDRLDQLIPHQSPSNQNPNSGRSRRAGRPRLRNR